MKGNLKQFQEVWSAWFKAGLSANLRGIITSALTRPVTAAKIAGEPRETLWMARYVLCRVCYMRGLLNCPQKCVLKYVFCCFSNATAVVTSKAGKESMFDKAISTYGIFPSLPSSPFTSLPDVVNNFRPTTGELSTQRNATAIVAMSALRPSKKKR
ncbi:hypothetical protein L596_005173 [Steinernema carpocapsae]|uniref:Uncharacterized protein n=1 Tax=Steinernema carpocapsae TaxID=34508 RepID=A0A4U8UZQ9_STECR|nr:hypothetical protein L596_005173 [Steinernema carpocapsae]